MLVDHYKAGIPKLLVWYGKVELLKVIIDIDFLISSEKLLINFNF